MKGDKYCVICGEYLGNYLTGNYYKLIRQTHCAACAAWKKSANNAFYQKEWRNRQKQQRRQQDKLIQALIEENKQLRQELIDRS